jgi:HD-like signal output (HDOD) protein
MRTDPPAPINTPIDTDGPRHTLLERANDAAAERLWRVAFAAPPPSSDDPAVPMAAAKVHGRVRDNVTAKLQLDALDETYFPRRPVLLPQLLQAIDDPRAEADKLSRIIARDPVLTVDVLRLANSSLYRVSPTPIESIPRAIVVCGVEGLRGMLVVAMVRPVFRATSKNFPRFPRLLWERTERAARAAELYAMATMPPDRFEAQLVVLLAALGPLVVYSAVMDVYSRNAHIAPSGELCVELIGALTPAVATRLARGWQTSPRLFGALENSPAETLTVVRQAGELLGTLSLLEAQSVMSSDECREMVDAAGLPAELAADISTRLLGLRRPT